MKSFKSTVLALFSVGMLMMVSYAALLDFKEMNQSFSRQGFSHSNEDLRNIASSSSNYSVLYFPLNNKNYERINGKWRIYNFIDNEDHDHKIEKTVSFELIGNSRIKIDNDNEQIFRVSYLTDHNTIAIFKKVGNGFEILEAIKSTQKTKKIKSSNSSRSNNFSSRLSENEVSQAKGVNLEEDVDLILERGFNPNISKNIFVGESVSGSLSIMSGKISGLRVVLARGLREEQSIDIEYADIKDGGVFETEYDNEVISGIVSNFGQGVYRVRFATGPMKGAMLNFVTPEEMDRLLESKSAVVPETRSLEVGAQGTEKAPSQYEAERKTASQNAQTMETPKANEEEQNENMDAEPVSKEEMEQNLSKAGFDFSQNQPKRSISSITLFAE